MVLTNEPCFVPSHTERGCAATHPTAFSLARPSPPRLNSVVRQTETERAQETRNLQFLTKHPTCVFPKVHTPSALWTKQNFTRTVGRSRPLHFAGIFLENYILGDCSSSLPFGFQTKVNVMCWIIIHTLLLVCIWCIYIFFPYSFHVFLLTLNFSMYFFSFGCFYRTNNVKNCCCFVRVDATRLLFFVVCLHYFLYFCGAFLHKCSCLC